MTQASKLEKNLASVVGDETYRVWLEMLAILVPHARTHRLAPLVAGMLQFATHLAYNKSKASPPKEGSVAHSLILASEEPYEEEHERDLRKIVESFFREAKVPYEKQNSRGQGYSIAEAAVQEFLHWEDMPWE